jgi:hypothetical protein
MSSSWYWGALSAAAFLLFVGWSIVRAGKGD